MSLLIDDREDTSITRALSGLDVDFTVARLDFGDCCWEGNGPRGPIMIGVERKHLSDLVSSMTDRRLAGFQAPGMRRLYDVLYLVIEDVWRVSDSGGIEQRRAGAWRPMYSYSDKSGVNYRQLDSYLCSISILYGVNILRSMSARETASIYAARYHWWRKPFDHHHTHQLIWSPEATGDIRRGSKAGFRVQEPGLVEQCASLLPGIDRKAWSVGKRFRTVEEMALAEEKDWREIPGIGTETARKAWEALHNPSDNGRQLGSGGDT